MESTVQRPAGRSALLFIFITSLLDVLALGVIIPVLPKLITRFEGGDMVRSAQIFGLFGTVWALMQFFFSPVLGALSDRFGRRPVILISNFGLGIDYIFMALAPTLTLLFVGRVISGITSASMPSAFAYISDVTPPEKRAGAFGLLGAAFGVGFVLGPALGGVLGYFDPYYPFWAAAFLSLMNFCYGYFVLPESLPVEKRSPFEWKKANPIGSLNLILASPKLPGLSAVYFTGMLAHVVYPSIYVLYTTYRFGWDERMNGAALAATGVCSGLVQGVFVGPIVKKFGERAAIVGGTFFGSVSLLMAGIAESEWLFWLSIPVGALWGIAGPSMQGLMTRTVGESDQGRLQGANSSLTGIAELIGPGLFTLTFAHFIKEQGVPKIPGAPFYLASGLLSISALLAWLVTRESSSTMPAGSQTDSSREPAGGS